MKLSSPSQTPCVLLPLPACLAACQVSSLQHLHKLSLPFPITASHLRCLCKLPRLSELLSFNQLELDVLGPAHDPLPHLTKLVASSIDSHGKPLSALFPALQSVYLRSCGDMEALALKSSGTGLGVLVAGDCSGLTDEGFAGLRALRGLTRLQVDIAHQVDGLGAAHGHGLCYVVVQDTVAVAGLGQVAGGNCW